MKAQRKISTAKMINRFDNELKKLLLSDLASVKSRNNHLVNSMKNAA